MPKREDINKIMIIGSGPIVIGQACEFDYSGTQACKALHSLGYEIVLVNSNPATIMTDPVTADVTYIEPLNVKRLTQIIDKERPDAILPNLGGQSGLNLCSKLYKEGVLDRYGVKVIGVQIDAIDRGEDRVEFKNTMNKLGIEMARSEVAYSIDEALKIADRLNYPVVLRPAYTMGGEGGGLVYNKDELRVVCGRGLQASMVGQVLVEESILGWEELELEIVRDSAGNMITVCFIENIDPLGVHTGDSFCCAPMLTISEELQNILQDQAYRIVSAIEVVGGTNVQFAHDPISDRVIVIEINPRASRSSALASKATGFPIAYVSALLATGITLEEIECGKYGTLDKYVPGGDYVVVKFARWAFEKFKGVENRLGTQMKAVGEVMSIGRTYKEAFLKAIRSLEIGRYGLGRINEYTGMNAQQLKSKLLVPTNERHFIIYEALKKGITIDEICELTSIKRYFIEQMLELVNEEKELESYEGSMPPREVLLRVKRDGFCDRYLGMLLKIDEEVVRQKREDYGILQSWKTIHVSGTKDKVYYYSTYNDDIDNNRNIDNKKNSIDSNINKKVMILGGGPNRIGQGIEFDYCCVHAAMSLRDEGFETIIVNCNPETVSTDSDTSDRLYFEPLTIEDVLSIYNHERPIGVITQFGGQTPLNIAADLERQGVNILGTKPSVIDMAEDRDLFRNMMDKLGIPMPESGMATNLEEARSVVDRIGYPVMVRPSYVLGGRGMEIVYDDESLVSYMDSAEGITVTRPILIDRFLKHATEVEADAICNGIDYYVPAVMEHIELAGVHSGDSACIIPSLNIEEKHIDIIKEYTGRIAKEMGVIGLMNMQYAIEDGDVYVLEANPRASRTVPLVSKVCNIPMISLATKIIIEEFNSVNSKMRILKDIVDRKIPYYGVKEAVFPFNMFPEVDPLLGPEMHSTGEVLGISAHFGEAFVKAQEATGVSLPTSGSVIISVNDRDKDKVPGVARDLIEAGFTILATAGTYDILTEAGIFASKVSKLYEGRPNIYDAIINGDVSMVINTPSGKESIYDDSYIRKAAIRSRTFYITTMAAAVVAAKGILSLTSGNVDELKSIQEHHADIE